MKQDLLTFTNWTPEAANELLALAVEMKANMEQYGDVLKGKSIVALFEKPSLRTRLSFEIGIHKLGGHLVYVDSEAGKLNGREGAADVAANIACWADGLIARVFSHNTLETFASAADVPVINALCDKYHPCQALADYLTLFEQFGKVKGLTLAYIGDGNNVTHSLLILGALLGCHQVVITPNGHEVDQAIFDAAQSIADQTGCNMVQSNDISAAKGASVLYTDTWLSMGDSTPLSEIKDAFTPYQINHELLKNTGATHAMHCQPAHRDLEITSAIIDSDASLLMQQAENRMYAQNAILKTLFA
ncbi:ornithine carbamoyltransferase [Alteromonas sediminis]|uniref:Ornithine carbamoyltransferase n=1 Tax=Alteromonas sediminis TaxID=2259342 RepID=A0A3N5Y013_9ALTE|nr:ornithine carbamoyltransferase [Alteromonas sediminis]RPJ66812.1 ornithine carbamoyltransferase [Alteromonas sediminis]